MGTRFCALTLDLTGYEMALGPAIQLGAVSFRRFDERRTLRRKALSGVLHSESLTSLFLFRYHLSTPMTPEERKRMNELCRGIQEEKDYRSFAVMLREMLELIERKEQRRFAHEPKIWMRSKPWKTLTARATKLLASGYGPTGKVEIAIPEADDLFREIRIENKLTSIDGKPVALVAGAQLTITVEAETSGTVPMSN